jgi:translation initiation factor 1A
MVKNVHGGNKSKRGKRSAYLTDSKRVLQYKEDMQEYGVVEKMLGDMRCSVLCSDSTVRVCHIRGKFKRRVWINMGDTVLIALRDFEDGKADVIHKYNAIEAELLKAHGEFDPTKLVRSDASHAMDLDNLLTENHEQDTTEIDISMI